MKKIILVLILSLFILPVCIAQEDFSDMSKEEALQKLEGMPLISGSMVAEISQTIDLLEEKFRDVEEAPRPEDAAVVIEGNNLNGIEQIFVSSVENEFQFMQRVKKIPSDEISAGQVMEMEKAVIIYGGPSQNQVSDFLFREGIVTKTQHASDDKLAIYEGETNNGAKILVVSDKRGFENVARLGAERSPLRQFFATPEGVIATSSLLSVILAALWARLGGVTRVVLARVITGKRKQKVVKDPDAKGFHVGSLKIKYRELFAILIAATAYSVGTTLALTGAGFPFMEVFVLAIVGGLAFYGVREFGRIVYCHYKDLHTEYTIWWPGAVFSVFTGYLGNTLNTPGVFIEHTDKEVKFDKYAAVKYKIIIGTALVAAILFGWNILFPHKGIQVFAVIASTYAAAEIVPVKPMPGKDVFKWKPFKATVSLLLIFTSYIVFNFVI